MEEKAVHFRQSGTITHCGVECLPNGKDIERIVIESITYHEEAINIGGRNQVGMWTCHFAPNPYTKLDMVLNATCRKRLNKLFPEVGGYLTLLKNVPVRLTKEKTRNPQDGSTCDGLRISAIPCAPEPQPAKKPLPIDKVDAVVKWAKEKGYGVAEVEKVYEMSKEVSEAIKKAMK